MTDDKSTTSFSLRVHYLEKILTQLESLSPENGELLQRWRQSLATTNELRLNFSLPVTCIGPVKSGKSTLINTLAGADLLPTGAGITTSFPTTLSAGQKFSADIRLQPETIVNEMFIRAANLLTNNDPHGAAWIKANKPPAVEGEEGEQAQVETPEAL